MMTIQVVERCNRVAQIRVQLVTIQIIKTCNRVAQSKHRRGKSCVCCCHCVRHGVHLLCIGPPHLGLAISDCVTVVQLSEFICSSFKGTHRFRLYLYYGFCKLVLMSIRFPLCAADHYSTCQVKQIQLTYCKNECLETTTRR